MYYLGSGEKLISKNQHLHDGKHGAALAVRITPRASKDRIVDILSDGTIKIHLKGTPSELTSNDGLLDFLAQKLSISSARLEIIQGSSGRD